MAGTDRDQHRTARGAARDPRLPHPGRFDPEPGRAGNLTAVPNPDQATLTPPGPPRPSRVRPTPLADLARRLDVPVTGGDVPVTGITHDSRAVRPGDLYAALPGARFHGAEFAAQAAANGAVAVLTDP
ncbi:MAG: UDP-N-acetylmuramoyl-L-alanyl-D-glutamate--2,6-diaminopimelate ligase, partial [Streptomyces sp.]|nr:UDP-N-acetylmuramoyl-L-alanyl-D-glutamate--2,6-diaminopimelate ligase [Streptomyces sp.]